MTSFCLCSTAKSVVEAMKMRYAAAVEDALTIAKELRGGNASVTVIPDGVSVIVERK